MLLKNKIPIKKDYEILELKLINYDGKEIEIMEKMLLPILTKIKKSLENYEEIALTIGQKEKYSPQSNEELEKIVNRLLFKVLKKNLPEDFHYLIGIIIEYFSPRSLIKEKDCQIYLFLNKTYHSYELLNNKSSFLTLTMQLTYLLEIYGDNFLQRMKIFDFQNNNIIDFEKREEQTIPEQLNSISFQYLKEKYLKRETEIQSIDDIYYFLWNKIQFSWIDENWIYHEKLFWFNEKYLFVPTTHTIIQGKGCSFDTSRIACQILRELGYLSKVRILYKKRNTEFGNTQYLGYVLFYKDNNWYLLRTDLNRKIVIPISDVKEEKKYWKKRKTEIQIADLPDDVDGCLLKEIVEKTFGNSRKRTI